VQTLLFACQLRRNAIPVGFLCHDDAVAWPGQPVLAWNSSVSTSASASRRLHSSAVPEGQQAVETACVFQQMQMLQYWWRASIFLSCASRGSSTAAVAAVGAAAGAALEDVAGC